jgi:SOS-response transcriptional repressor LexA
MKTDNMKSSDAELTHGLKDILSLLMVECDIDDAKLSREIGIPASTISRMRLNSDANPTASTLRPIAKFFSISISQLLGDEPLPENRLPGTHNPTSFTSVRMPIINWNQINQWIENQGRNLPWKLNNWISTEKNIGFGSFALFINTDSFGIAFRKGTTIIIDPEKSPLDGDLVLLKTKDDKNILLKQFLTDGNDKYIRSVNPEMKGIKILNEDDKILGVVIETRFSLQENQEKSRQKEQNDFVSAGAALSHKAI